MRIRIAKIILCHLYDAIVETWFEASSGLLRDRIAQIAERSIERKFSCNVSQWVSSGLHYCIRMNVDNALFRRIRTLDASADERDMRALTSMM
jgi:hypothetical protein